MAQVLEAEKLSFTNRLVGNTAFMPIDKGIGPDKSNSPFIDGSSFSDELLFHKSQGRDITVKINSPGGRVDHGWNMVDAIIEAGACTFATGMAYSMAGVCLMFGKQGQRKAYSHSSIMIHAPRGIANGEYLEVVKNQFRSLIESRTKFTKAEIDDMMDSGKDYFFTPIQAKKKGIIDEIVSTDLQVPVFNTINELHIFYNNHLDDNKNQNKNMEFFNKFFGGKDESESMVNAVQMKSENEALKAEKVAKDSEIVSLKAKVEQLENSSKVTDAKTKATSLIKDAIKANKIAPNAEDEAKLIENATANFDAVKMLIDSMPSKKSVAAAAIVNDSGKNEKKTYEWMAKNDPEGLKNLYETDPELFNKLSDEYSQSTGKSED